MVLSDKSRVFIFELYSVTQETAIIGCFSRPRLSTNHIRSVFFLGDLLSSNKLEKTLSTFGLWTWKSEKSKSRQVGINCSCENNLTVLFSIVSQLVFTDVSAFK